MCLSDREICLWQRNVCFAKINIKQSLREILPYARRNVGLEKIDVTVVLGDMAGEDDYL